MFSFETNGHDSSEKTTTLILYCSLKFYEASLTVLWVERFYSPLAVVVFYFYIKVNHIFSSKLYNRYKTVPNTIFLEFFVFLHGFSPTTQTDLNADTKVAIVYTKTFFLYYIGFRLS